MLYLLWIIKIFKLFSSLFSLLKQVVKEKNQGFSYTQYWNSLYYAFKKNSWKKIPEKREVSLFNKSWINV
jgi:hypothetical protein